MHDIPPDVRAAIGAFLNKCQTEARPFAVSEALGAIRGIFPHLDITDSALVDAITSEASTAGFDVEHDIKASKTRKRKDKALERWDNEGGAIARFYSARHRDSLTTTLAARSGEQGEQRP